MNRDNISTGFDRGARWLVAAINEALDSGKILPNQLPNMLVTLEKLMNEWGAEPLMHQQGKLVRRAIEAVHQDEFEPLE